VNLTTATADTWGIGAEEFLLAYAMLAAAVCVASVRTRRMLATTGNASPAADLAARPHDVAYLGGGAELAVYSALSAMHLRGTIASSTTSRGAVQAVGRLDDGTDELERAIHLTASGAVLRRRLPFHRPVLLALAATEQRLVSAGLLLPEEQRRRIRQVGWWTLAVAGLGLLRLLARVAEARPVGLLVLALLTVAAVAALQLAVAPRRTRLGDRVLADLRSEHRSLAPEAEPDWSLHGPTGVALGIAIFGTRALWAADPTFADELAAQRVPTGGSGSAGAADGGRKA
jgi:uncharacterized protein (TIGR04222 family)